MRDEEEASSMAGNQSITVTASHDKNDRPSGMSLNAALVTPASEKVVHHTDVRTKALGVKAELEALRSKQLAKNIRSEIGKHNTVHLSPTITVSAHTSLTHSYFISDLLSYSG